MVSYKALNTKIECNLFDSRHYFPNNYYTCVNAKSYLTASHRKTLKFAQLPNRYFYFSNTPLKVYSSIG